MAKIFISYRRSDSQDITGRIFDHLVERFGRDTVVRDIDSIQPGADYRSDGQKALAADESAWLAQRNACGKNADCSRNAYRARIGQLQSLH